MPYLSVDDAKAGWLGGEEPENLVNFDATRRLAARIVQKFAPAPEEADADYDQAASDAELFVGGYLMENPGRYSSVSIEAGSVSFTDINKLFALVSSAMPSEYMNANKAYISDWAHS